MGHLRKRIPVIVLVLMSVDPLKSASASVPGTRPSGPRSYSGDADGQSPSVCRIQILVEQPGYRYTVPQIQGMVRESEVVVRAVAVDSTQTLDGRSYVRFQTNEVLRGPFGEAEFTLTGYFVDEDGFNTLSVPYQLVRPAGGSCHAVNCRQGGEYLFLLKSVSDHLTPYWFDLGPTNERIRGEHDPWLAWVREQLAGDPGLGDQPSLP